MKTPAGLLLIVLCSLPQMAFAEAIATDEDYIYQVRQGDNLGKLSREVLDSPARWGEVARYNKLKNPNLITPGQRLRMQLAWLKNIPAEARIESLTGAVSLNGHPVKTGDAVPTGATVETPAGGSARLSLPDGSMMNVLEQSSLTARQLEKKERGNFFYTLFRLVTGRIEVLKKKYPAGQAPLHIQSRNATIGVRGTHFRMGQEDTHTLAEIEEGAVTFGAEQTSDPLALSGGQGSVADGIHPPQAIPLLPRPEFPAMPTSFPPAAIDFSMPELSGATGFRGEVAQDKDFQQLVAPVSTTNRNVHISALNEGRYWLRLRAVDEHGLQGLEGKTSFVVKVAAPHASPLVILPPVVLEPPVLEQGEHIVVNWHGNSNGKYELQVASSEDFKLPWITRISQGTQLDIPTPLAGRYFMRVRPIHGTQAGEWSNSVELIVP